MSAARIVPSLDELEDGPACFGLRAEAGSVDELAFEGGEEALAHGVVVAVADRASLPAAQPMDGLTPALAQRCPKAMEVY
jgi:hypothetical protein